ncbi:unnamed protein product [Lathyrus sativus]|nr:unnamed protein product [Lathyrus sativus]
MSTVPHLRIISSDVEEGEIEDHKSEIEVELVNEEKVERPNMELPEEKVERSNVEIPEEEFEGEFVPTWKKRVTFRAILVSLVLSILFTFIPMKLTLTTALIPPLNASSVLLGLMIVKTWTALLTKAGKVNQPKDKNIFKLDFN